MTTASVQAFPMSGAQSFATNSYMNTGDPSAMAFMNQQNYMMNSVAMMNPQYLAMQMQMQSQMPMNMTAGVSGGGMYNPSTMFNSYGGGMGSNQLPADPFNTSFNQQQAFTSQPQFNPVTGGFETMAGMQSAAMMNHMSTFPMMPEQMMMNAFPFGMSMPQQQQRQQQQLQQHQQNTSMQFQNPGTSTTQPQFTTPQQQQPQQQQQQPDPQISDFPETSLFDDAINSNLFDGFPEDAFLLEM